MRKHHPWDEEELQEIALAWFKGEISWTAVSIVLYGQRKPGSHLTQLLATSLRRGIMNKKITIS